MRINRSNFSYGLIIYIAGYPSKSRITYALKTLLGKLLKVRLLKPSKYHLA
ncbi:hypothetical protein NEOC84_001545|nr:hypothetical protein [Neochlamydia sp. AcF95]NGY95623.1 hypothetical protein [Neochlamydia sp. AcF84]